MYEALNKPDRSDALYAQWCIARGGILEVPDFRQIVVEEVDGVMVAALPGREIVLPGPCCSSWREAVATAREDALVAITGKPAGKPTIKVMGITVTMPCSYHPWYAQYVRAQVRALFKPMPAGTPWVSLTA